MNIFVEQEQLITFKNELQKIDGLDKVFVPPLKTQGIKTKLAPWIFEVARKIYKPEYRWVEPFTGSGVVALNTYYKSYLLADANPNIINFYNDLKHFNLSLTDVSKALEEIHVEFLKENKDMYYNVRRRFNNNPNSLDFLILNRSCFNGLMRFNKSGEFNSPFCKNFKRFGKAHITKILNQLNHFRIFLCDKPLELLCADFRETLSRVNENDIVYCDPPYMGRNACYYNNWTEKDEMDLYDILSNAKFKFLLSTWFRDKHRENPNVEKYKKFNILEKNHFYFIGPKEENRYAVTEALVTNLDSI